MHDEKKDSSNCCSGNKCCCAKKLMCLIMAILVFALGYFFGKHCGGQGKICPMTQGMQK